MKLQAMAEEMEGHGTSFIGGLMKAAGSLAGAAGALGGLAGKGQSILIPEPKAETPRDRFKLILAMKRAGYPDDHSPQPDAGSQGQMGFKGLHWARHEVANALRAMESMKFVKEQARVAKAIADKAAVQLTYLMESPCLRGVGKQPGNAATLPDDRKDGDDVLSGAASAKNSKLAMCPAFLSVLLPARLTSRRRAIKQCNFL
ncbi:unnamed protein product [Effrenium voratum]|uniref:Uncharacterized protein n=1 Tax=Effrenium voratum TaxID=2562239 RepID=A0AA36I778_9DINO|nr:unnamed protein product [Effrenium voratum]CAJ1457255.1 unnamed protein product [Effrenium voratum]